MKRYSFPLERVLDWKTIVAEREQTALQTLHQQQEAMTASLLSLSAQIDGLSSDGHQATSGHELAYTAQARSLLLRDKARAEKQQAAVESRIVEQQARFRSAETERRLMDKLKDRSYDTWSAGLAKEVDETAADLFLGSWKRR